MVKYNMSCSQTGQTNWRGPDKVIVAQ